MDKPVLSNPDEYPDGQVLSEHLEEVKLTWDELMKHIATDHAAFEVNWRYYKDGHNWLCKITKKAKTICWISIWSGFFKTTFYFGDKAEQLIVNSDLDKAYVNQYLNGTRYGKIRAITVEVSSPVDLEPIGQLIAIKEKLK